MPRSKYYAIKKGRNTGIFNSWSECKQYVQGYSGAIYRSFSNKEDAEAYLNNKDNINNYKKSDMVAYVDGSYDSNINYYSYAVIVLHNGKRKEYYDANNIPDIIKMNNVAGEIEAAKLAMKIALQKGVETLIIHYDYEGIERWCTGEWNATKKYTKEYKDFYNNIKEELNIIFQKVKAHSGNTVNEEVDLLAKKALKNINKPEEQQLEDCQIYNNKIIPVINIKKIDGQIINTKEIFKIFKNKWKSKNNLIKEIDELQIIYNIKKGEIQFLVESNGITDIINIVI